MEEPKVTSSPALTDADENGYDAVLVLDADHDSFESGFFHAYDLTVGYSQHGCVFRRGEVHAVMRFPHIERGHIDKRVESGLSYHGTVFNRKTELNFVGVGIDDRRLFFRFFHVSALIDGRRHDGKRLWQASR